LSAILVLDTETFKIVDAGTDKLIEKNTSYKYAQIEQVVMRARHEHMDLRFKGTGPIKDRRLRLMSSYLQVLTNQFWVRSKKLGNEPAVIFEPLVRKFDYKDDRVCIVPPASRDTTNGASSSGFIRTNNTQQQKSSHLLDHADAQTRADLDYVDKQLDVAMSVTQNVVENARKTNSELTRQNELMDKTNHRATEAVDRTKNFNERLDHQNKKY